MEYTLLCTYELELLCGVLDSYTDSEMEIIIKTQQSPGEAIYSRSRVLQLKATEEWVSWTWWHGRDKLFHVRYLCGPRATQSLDLVSFSLDLDVIITNIPKLPLFFFSPLSHFCWEHGFYFMNLENPTFPSPRQRRGGKLGLFRLRWVASD